MTPTARTLKYLRKANHEAGGVEKWNPHSKTRHDLFGVFDIVAITDDAVVGGPFAAAWWTFATCAVRVLWLALGVGELMHGSDLVYVIAAYALPAAAATGVMRAIEVKRG